MHFESRVPNDWEKKHLPIILLTGETWNPSEEIMRYGKHSKEVVEMQTIRSLTSGISKRQVALMQSEYCGETDMTLGQVSGVYDNKCFCE